jgi:uncharacterized damage-inducible protein DinB
MITQAETLARCLEKTRETTLDYFNRLQNSHLHERLIIHNAVINSSFWTLAHLAVSENFLCLHATGGNRIKIPWARNFGLGSIPPEEKDCPPLSELLSISEEVHKESCKHIRQLTDDLLSDATITGTSFGGEDKRNSVLIHAIRHEGVHAGHLGLMCRVWLGASI